MEVQKVLIEETRRRILASLSLYLLHLLVPELGVAGVIG